MSEMTPDDVAPPSSPADPFHRLTDYEQTVEMIRLLTDVRFKLAAFVPVVTAAAVGAIRASHVVPLTQALLGLGGLTFTFGIVVYDLRNSQHYNSACGRARELEKILFDRYGGDREPGLLGSRSDSDATHERRRTDRFFALHVRHRTGLALVYASTATAWVWVILDAVADRLDTPDWRWEWRPGTWLQDPAYSAWVAAGLSLLFAAVFLRQHLRHDRDPSATSSSAPGETAD